MKRTIRIETREHLLATLAEAAELEHNLMCMYLYAAFSLKRLPGEDLSTGERQAIERWHRAIMGVAVQEMGHLALVSNVMTAVGGAAHFFRTSFPVRPGYFPDDFVMQLAPFDDDTLEHFVFLERPEDERVLDDANSSDQPTYIRGSPRGRLMTYVGDYETVGQLYEAVARGIEFLAQDIGERTLFCGSSSIQIGPDDVKLPGLIVIKDQKTALTAISAIIEQGEGGKARQGSHFETFCGVQAEYRALVAKNPQFRPARPAARNPVMRKPVVERPDVVWVDHASAAVYLDLGNALYGLMLRLLSQVYAHEGRDAESKKALLDSAFVTMHLLSETASFLTTMPASSSNPTMNAGLSFSLERPFTILEVSSERQVLIERVVQIAELIDELQTSDSGKPAESSQMLKSIAVGLDKIRELLGINLG